MLSFRSDNILLLAWFSVRRHSWKAKLFRWAQAEVNGDIMGGRPVWWRPWCASDWQCLVIRGCGLDGLSEGKWCKTVALCFVALLGPMPVAPLNEMDRLACLLAGRLAPWWTGWLPGWLAGRQATPALKVLANLSFLCTFFLSFVFRLLEPQVTL